MTAVDISVVTRQFYDVMSQAGVIVPGSRHRYRQTIILV